jgi:hypothetical protein
MSQNTNQVEKTIEIYIFIIIHSENLTNNHTNMPTKKTSDTEITKTTKAVNTKTTTVKKVKPKIVEDIDLDDMNDDSEILRIKQKINYISQE